MKNRARVIIVGGGASGMMAAISAARSGSDVTILERNPRVGKKILATGNGRCNFTNVNADIECFYGSNPKFAYSALSSFSVDDTIAFFEKLGIAHKVEDFGKVFPMSDQASSVLDVLLYELEQSGINVVCNAFVKEIRKYNDAFIIRTEDGQTIKGDKVIISAGGRAMPSSGSDGNGYDLAKMLGHTITDVYPSLVQLKLEGPYFKQIDGVKFAGTAEIIAKNKTIARESGDILFANYGVSGPPVMQLSRPAGELLNRGVEPVLKITIIDMMSREELKTLMLRRFQLSPGKTVDFSLVGLVNKRLIPVLLKEAGISSIKKSVKDLSADEKDRIINILTDLRFKVTGTKGWTSAQATAGGVNTREIDQATMESKLVKGLYFSGEIIDIDGKCGGFNLQWAWSSGFIAGQSAALSAAEY